jgi:hypothetical protein
MSTNYEVFHWKEKVYWKEMLREMRPGCIILSPKANNKACSGNTLLLHQQKKFKNVPSAKKRVMLILFCAINGPILEHYMEHGQTVNSQRNSAMLKDKLLFAVNGED